MLKDSAYKSIKSEVRWIEQEYCGHYHTQKKIEKLEIMFEYFDEFSLR